MLKTFSSRKRYLLPSFLALFYFVIGAHALHPHFHDHNDIQPDYASEHLVSDVHHHPAAISVFASGPYHSCPICGFLAVSSALEIGAVRFFIPSYPDQRADADYQLPVIPVHQTGFHIRGPPALFSC